MNKKKLQTYYGTVAYKADKTPVKRAFHGRSKADAKAKYFAYIAEHGQAEKCSDLYTVSGWAAQWLLLYKRPYITDPAYSTTYELPIRRHVLPALGNEMIVLLKETSISGYVGTMDLTKGGDIIRSTTYEAYLPLFGVAAIYLVIVMLMTAGVNRLERKLRTNER